jgi:hypothetical protein
MNIPTGMNHSVTGGNVQRLKEQFEGGAATTEVKTGTLNGCVSVKSAKPNELNEGKVTAQTKIASQTPTQPSVPTKLKGLAEQRAQIAAKNPKNNSKMALDRGAVRGNDIIRHPPVLSKTELREMMHANENHSSEKTEVEHTVTVEKETVIETKVEDGKIALAKSKGKEEAEAPKDNIPLRESPESPAKALYNQLSKNPAAHQKFLKSLTSEGTKLNYDQVVYLEEHLNRLEKAATLVSQLGDIGFELKKASDENKTKLNDQKTEIERQIEHTPGLREQIDNVKSIQSKFKSVKNDIDSLLKSGDILSAGVIKQESKKPEGFDVTIKNPNAHKKAQEFFNRSVEINKKITAKALLANKDGTELFAPGVQHSERLQQYTQTTILNSKNIKEAQKNVKDLIDMAYILVQKGDYGGAQSIMGGLTQVLKGAAENILLEEGIHKERHKLLTKLMNPMSLPKVIEADKGSIPAWGNVAKEIVQVFDNNTSPAPIIDYIAKRNELLHSCEHLKSTGSADRNFLDKYASTSEGAPKTDKLLYEEFKVFKQKILKL